MSLATTTKQTDRKMAFDEKLIKPIDWAEKTDIVTREGLEAALAEED